MNIDIIGYIAASLTTISFIPQALKVIKTKDTKSISLAKYLLFTMGVFLWLIYGIALVNQPIIIANVITLILSGFILFKKIKD